MLQQLAPSIRVLVVDDSVVVRRMVGRAIEADDCLELAGVAPNGVIALAKLATVRPDVVVLDLAMPLMDGFDVLGAIRRTHPDLPVIVFSSRTKPGAKATLDAMALGATAYAFKPTTERVAVLHGPGPSDDLGEHLLPLIKALGTPSSGLVGDLPHRASSAPRGRIDVVVIAVSTGGPAALDTVLCQLPVDLAVPVLVVQHMPPIFTGMLAERLDARAALPVAEATDGMVVDNSRVYIAPGGRHMGVRRLGTQVSVALNDKPAENSCRPAADVLFRSVVEAYGPAVLGVVMTGMGNDGLRGSARVRAAGGAIIAQTPGSSVVASMPIAVIEAGLADAVVELDRIATEVRRRLRHA